VSVFFQCQVEKKVLFDIQKLTSSAEEQMTHGIQSERMPRGKIFIFYYCSFSVEKTLMTPIVGSTLL